MTLDWQLVATLGLVALAAGEVLRRTVRALAARRAGSCDRGCGSCAAASAAPVLVELRT